MVMKKAILGMAFVCCVFLPAAAAKGKDCSGLYAAKDFEKAFSVCAKAAQGGDSQAQYTMGLMHNRGEGVAQNSDEALKWFHISAAQDNPDALSVLSFMAHSAGNAAGALEYSKKAAENGHLDSQVSLGVMYCKGMGGVAKDYQQAAKWLGMAINQGSPKAQAIYDSMRFKGEGVKKFSKQEAAGWLKKSYEYGPAEAQGVIASMYYEGDGVEKNLPQAVRWYKRAAESGFAAMQLQLGFMYYTGEGVKKDLKQAFKWTYKAAEGGKTQAQFNLGQMYYAGDGVAKSKVRAYTWFLVSSKLGHAESDSALKQLRGELSARERETATKEANRLYKKIAANIMNS